MPLLSIIIPSRERAHYIGASIATVLQAREASLEVLVLDNASADNTYEVVNTIDDPRLRYVRSEQRLSMRDNFERGLALAKGDYIGFIGDDDGIFDYTPSIVHQLFAAPEVMAIAAARAHYFWPDLVSKRKGSALLPRGGGIEYRNSRHELYMLLETMDYYQLPCIYHGFVRRSLIDRLRKGRFFLSSQVDIYSAIALSMADITFAYSYSPLVINGSSARSNGASHFGGGTSEERTRWKQEDDLGFLPGFENHATVTSLIVESALRYIIEFGGRITDIFPQVAINEVMAKERQARLRRGMSVEGMDRAEIAVGSPPGGNAKVLRIRPLIRLFQSFSKTMPVDAEAYGVHDVFDAARLLQGLLARGWSRNLDRPIEQVCTAIRIGRS